VLQCKKGQFDRRAKVGKKKEGFEGWMLGAKSLRLRA